MASEDRIEKMSVPKLLKIYGSKIEKEFGADELKLIKDEAKGPGGTDRARKMIKDLVMNVGGLATKTYVNPVTFVNNLKRK